MNKKVVLINQVTGPLFIDIANQYINEDNDVILITGAIEETYATLDSKIKIVYKQKYNRKKAYSRIYTWALFYLQCYIFLLFNKSKFHKALLVSNPPIITFLGSFLLKRKKIEFDVLIYDVYPDTLSNFGYLKNNSVLYNLWDNLNVKSFKNANRIITISNVMKKLISRNINKEKIEVIYPWVDTSFIQPLPKKDNWFVKKYNLLEKRVILYSGNMGATHDLITPLKAAKKLMKTNPEFHFLYIGDGVQKKALISYKLKNNLSNVTFLPFQESDVLPYSFSSADFGVVSLGTGAEGLSVPSKTFYFLASGSTILAITEKGSEIDFLVNDNNCGASIEPNNVDSLIKFLLKTTINEITYYKINNRLLSKKFTPLNAKKFIMK
jgi:glycosyltransferase involved in cell wall biosynthesis